MADEPKEAETTDESDPQTPRRGTVGRRTSSRDRPITLPDRVPQPPNQKSKAQKKQKSGGKKRGR
jgi:hypothetical protein